MLLYGLHAISKIKNSHPVKFETTLTLNKLIKKRQIEPAFSREDPLK